MPGRPGRMQGSFVSGELAETLEARRDLKYYRSGLRRAVNLIPLPQGPATLRPGFRQVGRIRRALEPVSLAGATVAAPSGGTASAAIDGDAQTRVTTGTLSGAGPHVVLELDFHGPRTIAAVDVNAFRAGTTGRISVEYWGGTDWQSLNGERVLRAAERSRRFCAPPNTPVVAAVWRVAVRDLAGAGTVELGEIAFHTEGTAYGATRLRSFGYSRDEAYDLVLMAGHGDVYAAGGGWLTGFALPHGDADLMHSRWRQQLNTGLIFCPTRPPVRLFRENADLEWQVGPMPMKDLPEHDFGDVDYTNGVPAIWDFQFVNFGAQKIITITVDGEETSGIGPFSFADLIGLGGVAPDIVAAIEDLPNISPGVTWATASAPQRLRITFTGAGNEGQVIVNSTRVLNAADAAVSWQRVQKGRKGGEPLFSDPRGWPRCGAFYQQRLVMGGAPGVPNAFIASVTGEYFNFNTEITRANGAFVIPMDTAGAEIIEEILPARSLLIFTSEGEYWVANAALSKEQAPTAMKMSAYGMRSGTPVVELDDSAVFVSAAGAALIECRYNEVDQTFSTQRLSVLATHLVRGVSDIALRRAAADTDAALLWYVQDDGALRIVTRMREQEVTGFGQVDTDGRALGVVVNAANGVSLLFERQVDGIPVRILERAEEGLLLDQAVTVALDPPSAEVSGLHDLEGAEVWALADGWVHGPFVVFGGAVALPVPVAEVTVGRWRPFLAETLPPNREVGPGIVTESPVGYHTVRLSLMGTTSVAVGANGGAPVDVPLLDFGGAADVPPLAAPFTGTRVVEGLSGAEDNPTAVVTQLRPGAITLRAVTLEGDF